METRNSMETMNSKNQPRFYVAYGSNIPEDQMAMRCPDARLVGTAILRDWQLLFRGVATIEKHKRRNTPVVVWEISEEDEKHLDVYEGYPHLYYKKMVRVEVFPIEGGNARWMDAMVYIMQDSFPLAEPTPGYFKVIYDGYKAFHFPRHVLRQALEESLDDVRAASFLERNGY